MSDGPNPWQQRHWDARAAGNFIGGGCGAGLIVFAALAGVGAKGFLVGAVLVAAGLFSVFLEIGRPLRAANVVVNPGQSWMSREALVAPVLLLAALASALGVEAAELVAGLAGLAYLYCQARMLQACKGIPAWRAPLAVPLMVATGLAEGGGLALVLAAFGGRSTWMLVLLVAVALVARLILWSRWRASLTSAPRALKAIDAAGARFRAATWLPLALLLMASLALTVSWVYGMLLALAGLIAAGGGWWFKFTLITRSGFNQGFAITRLPVRGVRRVGPGA